MQGFTFSKVLKCFILKSIEPSNIVSAGFLLVTDYLSTVDSYSTLQPVIV